MNTHLPIQPIHHEIPLKVSIAPALVIPVIGGTVSSGLLQAGLISDTASLIAVIVTMALGAWWATRFMQGRLDQANVYKERLKAIPQDILIALHASPELDTETRCIILEHLNEKHPGWSLQTPQTCA